MTSIEPGQTPICLPPGVGIQLDAVYIPQLAEIMAAFAQQNGLLMALQESIDANNAAIAALEGTVTDEIAEVMTILNNNTAAVNDAVQAAADAVARADLAESEKAAIQASLDEALAALDQSATAISSLVPQVESISGDVPAEPPAEPPADGGGEPTPEP